MRSALRCASGSPPAVCASAGTASRAAVHADNPERTCSVERSISNSSMLRTDRCLDEIHKIEGLGGQFCLCEVDAYPLGRQRGFPEDHLEALAGDIRPH